MEKKKIEFSNKKSFEIRRHEIMISINFFIY